MNKLLILLLLLPLSLFAQKNKHKVGVPFVDGKVVFDSTFVISGKDQASIYHEILKLCRVHDYVLAQDPQHGKASAMGHTNCPTAKGETIRYHIFFTARDSSLNVRITNISFKTPGGKNLNTPELTYDAEQVFASENYFKPNGRPNPLYQRFRDCTYALVNMLYQKSVKVASK